MSAAAAPPVRLLAWNVNHRSQQRKIPATMATAIASLRPDIVLLTEYVPGPSRNAFISDLAYYGLLHVLGTERVLGQNSVLIASRTPLRPGRIRAPAIDAALPSNVLHVTVPEQNLELLGIRIPDYSRAPALRRACWDWILDIGDRLRARPSVILGDFNTSPVYPPSRCGDRISAMVASGWQLSSPASGASYWTPKGRGVQIDHAFTSPHLVTRSSRYVVEDHGHVFAVNSESALSDHAALEISIQPRME